MNPYIILGAVVFWIVTSGGAFWFGTSFQKGQQAKQEVLLDAAEKRFVAAQQKFTDDLSLQIAGEFSNIKIVNRVINNEIHHEREIQTRVLDNPDCNVPASTVQLLNRSRGYDATSESAGRPASGMRQDGAAAQPAK